MAQEPTADASAVIVGRYGQEQELRLVRHSPEQGEADRFVRTRVAREHQRDPTHWKNPRELRPGPGFAEAIAECPVHDRHDLGNALRRAWFNADVLLDRRH